MVASGFEERVSVAPYRLFLVFNELVAAQAEGVAFDPAYMLDQSHNVTDPIESLMTSAMQVQRSFAQALLVDRAALDQAQEANDALAASQLLKQAFQTDVEPLLQRIRADAGAAIDPVAVFRRSGYRQRAAVRRPRRTSRACPWNWAANRRASSSPTPTWIGRSIVPCSACSP